MEHEYRISFHRDNVGFEIETTDLDWFERVVASPAVAEVPARETTQMVPQNLTINEFFKKYIKPNNISSRADIVVFFVYFLQKVLKREALKTADVAQCFADVSYPNYSKLNVTDILHQARRRGLLNNVNSLWSLTITGEDFVLGVLTSEPK
jgi:hypothetical protein